jgi:hypothetical protein
MMRWCTDAYGCRDFMRTTVEIVKGGVVKFKRNKPYHSRKMPQCVSPVLTELGIQTEVEIRSGIGKQRGE